MTKPENRDVIFRRIRGKIVPIRVNKSGFKNPPKRKSSKLRGSAEIAAGVAVAGAGGFSAAGQTRKFIQRSLAADTLIKFAKGQKPPKQTSTIKTAVKNFAQAKTASRRGIFLKAGGIFFGGALLGSGLNKLRDDETGFDAELGSQFGATLATGVSTAVFTKRFGGLKKFKQLANLLTKKKP